MSIHMSLQQISLHQYFNILPFRSLTSWSGQLLPFKNLDVLSTRATFSFYTQGIHNQVQDKVVPTEEIFSSSCVVFKNIHIMINPSTNLDRAFPSSFSCPLRHPTWSEERVVVQSLSAPWRSGFLFSGLLSYSVMLSPVWTFPFLQWITTETTWIYGLKGSVGPSSWWTAIVIQSFVPQSSFVL